MDDTTEMVARLDALAAKHDAEAKRYKAAADLLRGTAKPATAPFKARATKSDARRLPNGTMNMVIDVLTSHAEPLSPPELAERMLAAGWVTESDNPANTVRTALRRLVDKSGSGVSVLNGKYFV
jgi:hypothetical protein